MGALQDTCGLGVAEECYRLVEHVTSNNIGEDESIGLSVDDTLDTFLVQRHAVEGCLQVKGTIDDASPKLSTLGLGNDFEVVDGIGESLGADFLGTVDERDAWFVNAQGMTDVVHVTNLLATLCRGGDRDNGSIGEEQQFLVLGNLGHSDMCQHMALAEDTVLLVENGTQQDIGIDESLHQDVGLTILTHCYSTTSTFVLVVAVHVDGFDESHLLAFLYCIARAGIVGTDHSHTFAVSPLLQEDNHVVKGSYWFHSYLGLTSTAKPSTTINVRLAWGYSGNRRRPVGCRLRVRSCRSSRAWQPC